MNLSMKGLWTALMMAAVLAAADRVFRLADSDYVLQHRQSGFTAHRPWYLYLVFGALSGSDTWQVEVRPEGWGGSRISVVHSGTSATGTPAPATTV